METLPRGADKPVHTLLPEDNPTQAQQHLGAVARNPPNDAECQDGFPANPAEAPESAARVGEALLAAWEEVESALGPVIGLRAVATLYQRSLYLSVRHYPWLASAHRSLQAPVELPLLMAALAQQGSAEASAGGLAHLEAFRRLLTAILGNRLTERLLPKVWTQNLNLPFAEQKSP